MGERGWRLFPCGSRSKLPLIKKWQVRASSKPAVILRWAKKYPNCNWAVATGADSDDWVLDVDGELGERSLATLVKQHGELSQGLIVRTREGRYHLHSRCPKDGRTIRCSRGKVAPHIDVRGEGGYTLVPPSIHPETGEPYQFMNDVPEPHLSEWIIDKAVKANLRLPAPPRADPIGILPIGTRNDTLIRRVGYWCRTGFTLAEVEAKLREADRLWCRPPLSEDEILLMLKQAAKWIAESDGLDPLERAWAVVDTSKCRSTFDDFITLCDQLQKARPSLPIALPIDRLAELFHRTPARASQLRKRACERGFLQLLVPAIPHRRSATFSFSRDPTLPMDRITPLPMDNLTYGQNQEHLTYQEEYSLGKVGTKSGFTYGQNGESQRDEAEQNKNGTERKLDISESSEAKGDWEERQRQAREALDRWKASKGL